MGDLDDRLGIALRAVGKPQTDAENVARRPVQRELGRRHDDAPSAEHGSLRDDEQALGHGNEGIRRNTRHLAFPNADALALAEKRHV
jgi:hypothetical protein